MKLKFVVSVVAGLVGLSASHCGGTELSNDGKKLITHAAGKMTKGDEEAEKSLVIGALDEVSGSEETLFSQFRTYERSKTESETPQNRSDTAATSSLSSPQGLAVDSNNRTIVAESGAHEVAVFGADGSELFSFGSHGSGDRQFISPWDIEIGPDDTIYVADSGNNRIQVFDDEGNYITQFGSYGTDPGQFNGPKGIYIHEATGKIYVADTGNHRVQRFNDDFSLDTSWGTDGVVGATGVVKRDHTGFDRPMDMGFNPINGRVYIADYGNHRLERYDTSGNYIFSSRAVYRPNKIIFDDDMNCYIAGEDPNNNYTYFDGRLRFLKAETFLISRHYTGGIDDIGRIQGGVAIRGDGAIVFSDTYNNRLVKTDSSFSEPISDLDILAQGTSITFRWKTGKPGPSSVRYGPTSSYGTEVTDPAVTTDHELVVSGLTPNTRLFYGVSFPDSFDGTQRWTPQDVLNTGAPAGQTQFQRFKCAGMIYLDTDSGPGYVPMTTGQFQAAYDRYDTISRFYWINSGFKLWLDYTIIEIDRNVNGSLWLWSVMEDDLSDAGYSAADDFDAVHAAAHIFSGNYGGSGTLFGRSIGTCQWVTQGDFVAIHERNHSIESIYSRNDLRKYEFNHGIWAVPNGVGGNFAVNGQILRNMLPVNYTATKSPYTKVMTAPDADNDGLPDSSPGGLTNPLSITEATLGSSTASADTDSDGLTDLEEAMMLVYHGSDLNSGDSDGDDVPDANDLNPAYLIRDHIGKATPNIDGVISPREWTVITTKWGYSNDALVSDNDSYQGQTKTYAAWDDDYLYLALKGPSSTANIHLDGSADNWYMSPDSYHLTLRNGSYSRSVRINVGVPDIFRQVDNDGQFSELFDTSSMFTNPWQGRTLYNNPGDGFGFPSRLVSESDLVYERGGSGDNFVWELAIPWSKKTLLEGYDGKMMAIQIELSGDKLFETDHAARIKLVDAGAPEITEISYSEGAVTLTFDSVPSMRYRIYYKDDIDGAWTRIEGINGTGGTMQYVDDGTLTDPNPVDVPFRSYQIGL